jgi:hypothetical protein
LEPGNQPGDHRQGRRSDHGRLGAGRIPALPGQKAGTDYTCLPGLGVNEVISTGGDAFYFPLLKDAEKSKAQEVLAKTLLDPKTQVAFNLKKGSLPVRGDVDLAAANDCMKKGLEILAKGNVVQVQTSCCLPTARSRRKTYSPSSSRTLR